MLARLAAAFALALSLTAQQPSAAPLRCQVVDDSGKPRAGITVTATLRTSGAEPVRAAAVTAGAEAIATFAQWSIGDGNKGTVDLEVAMLGAQPHRVVDLAHADPAAPARIALPPTHALVIDVRTADGTPLPIPLRAHLTVTATAGSASLQATTDGEQRARLEPIAQDTALQLQLTPLGATLAVPAWSRADDQSVSWTLPNDLVIVQGRATAPPGIPFEPVMTLALQQERSGSGAPIYLASDGSFATLLGQGWIGAKVEARLVGKTTSSEPRPLPAPFVAGNNDLGTWPLTSAAVLIEGDLTIDGEPAPAGTPLLCRMLGADIRSSLLPPTGRTDARGHFAIEAPAPAGVHRVAVQPGNGMLHVQGNSEFDLGTRNATIAFVSPPQLRVEVLFDDASLAEPLGYHLLVRRADGREFGTLLQQLPAAPAGHMVGAWPGIAGGSYRLRFLLRSTGEVLYESDPPIEIAKPTIAATRTLPTIDLRGKLRVLRLRLGDRVAGRTLLLLRSKAGQPWRAHTPWQTAQPIDRMLVTGPVDVAILGENIAYELFPQVERELHLAPKPAPTVAVRLETVPQLPAGWQLRITGTHDAFAVGGEFDPDGSHRGNLFATETVVAADGTANVPLPVPGTWHLRLVAYNTAELARGSTSPTPFGDSTDVVPGKPIALSIDVDELARIIDRKK